MLRAIRDQCRPRKVGVQRAWTFVQFSVSLQGFMTGAPMTDMLLRNTWRYCCPELRPSQVSTTNSDE